MTGRAEAGEPHPRVLTLEQWADLDEDEPGELVDGLLEEEEVPSVLHEVVVAWLVRMLGAWAAPRSGWVFGSELKYALSPRRGRKPDVSLYLAGSPLPRRTDSVSREPPSVAIEVLSRSPRDERRDRIEKRADYAAFGVRYYWLLDPEARTLEVFELGDDRRYIVALSVAAGSTAVPGCEGLVLDLDELWRTLDSLPAE
jgi:Uma2 family endonuclease